MSNAFTTLYLCFTSFIVVSGLTMIVTYSLSYAWWRSSLGRMVVLYASAEISMSAILCLAVVWHVNPAWFRGVWFTLQAIVGCTFCAQTVAILRLFRQRRQKQRALNAELSAE